MSTAELQRHLNNASPFGTIVEGWSCEQLDAPLTIPAGVKLANGCLQCVSPVSNLITFEDGAGLVNVDVQGNGNVTNRIVQAIGKTNTLIERVRTTGENEADIFYLESCANSSVMECVTRAGWNAIVCRGDNVENINLKDNDFASWRQRAIYVVADETGTKDISIINNKIRAHRPAAPSPKQPIAIQSPNEHYHRSIKVNRNNIEGLIDHSEGAGQQSVTGNTSDNISLHWCLEFECDQNHSAHGGELGILVARGCTQGSVSRNLVFLNDVAGISIGANGPAANPNAPVSWIHVEGNTCWNNGRIVDNDINPDFSGGLWAENADQITFSSNMSFDTGVGYQRSGLVTRNTTNIYDNNNQYSGNYGQPVLNL